MAALAKMNQALHPFIPPKNTSQRIDDRNLVDTKTEIQAEFPRFAGLERWELLKKLGHGGFSTVYQARDLDGKAGEVAIKIVDKCGIEVILFRLGGPQRLLLCSSFSCLLSIDRPVADFTPSQLLWTTLGDADQQAEANSKYSEQISLKRCK